MFDLAVFNGDLLIFPINFSDFAIGQMLDRKTGHRRRGFFLCMAGDHPLR